MPSHPWLRWILPTASGAVGFAILFWIPILLGRISASAMDVDPAHRHPHGFASEEEMRRWVRDWYSTHPEVGGAMAATVNGDTFLVQSNLFNSDGNVATQVDTAKVLLGESVFFQWVQGFHTATSGAGAADPQAGAMYDFQIGNPLQSQATPPFNNTGTFPLFCRPHEGINMRGFVLVRAPVEVEPTDGVALGFTLGPIPNPSRAGIHFGFALREAGRVRADVLDVHGRQVAAVLDRHLEAGAHDAAWNGHGDQGASAPAGVYYLRLRVPGLIATRRFVVTP